MFTIVAGDETGLVKLWTSQQVTILGSSEQSREKGVLSIDKLNQDSSMHVLRKNGLVEQWKADETTASPEIALSYPSSISHPMGIRCYDRDTRIIFGASGDVALESDAQITSTHQIKGPISVLQPLQGGYAAAGRENDIQFYDLETQQVQWSAVNVPDDYLKYSFNNF